MFAVWKVDAEAIMREDLADRIVALDRTTMSETLSEAGIEFPEEKRREGLKNPSTVVILLLDDNRLAGYVEFCEDYTCSSDIYISSIQLLEKYRGGIALPILIVECAKELRERRFGLLKTNVQKNNLRATELYKKLGFRVTEKPGSERSLNVTGDGKLLSSELILKLEKAVAGKYNRKGNI